jgi:hypothetical protein
VVSPSKPFIRVFFILIPAAAKIIRVLSQFYSQLILYTRQEVIPI